jgi:SOS-response transcriptional repressor LexA
MQQERAANDFDEGTYFAVDELRRSHRRINNFVASLETKRYVYRVGNSVHLGSEAEEFFNSFYESMPLARKYDVIPAQVPVRGNVHAGPGTPVEFNDESIKRIPVPDIRLGRKMYALKVVGVSMKSEGILDGDYVIIEEFIDSEGPKPNEIVVARYVELADVMKNPEIEPDERIMFGHTLKRFKEEVTAKPKRYRLSRLETPDHNPFLIEAAQVELVGRIASLYRDYR